MQKKDDKVGNKTANKEGKKRERERKIENDSPKKVQILAFAHVWKTKKLFNYSHVETETMQTADCADHADCADWALFFLLVPYN